MNSILQRIKEAYRLETDAEVADFLGIKPSTLSMQKNRGRLNLQRIIERCSDLNKNWLLDGEGEIWQNIPQSENNRIPIYSSLNVENHIPDLHKSIKAGSIFANVTDELQYFSSSDQVIGYVISSDSMAPVLRKNDIAIIDMDSSGEDGIYLFSTDQKIFFSRIKEKTGSLILKNGENQEKRRIYGDGINMIGEVVWILRRMNR